MSDYLNLQAYWVDENIITTSDLTVSFSIDTSTTGEVYKKLASLNLPKAIGSVTSTCSLQITASVDGVQKIDESWTLSTFGTSFISTINQNSPLTLKSAWFDTSKIEHSVNVTLKVKYANQIILNLTGSTYVYKVFSADIGKTLKFQRTTSTVESIPFLKNISSSVLGLHTKLADGTILTAPAIKSVSAENLSHIGLTPSDSVARFPITTEATSPRKYATSSATSGIASASPTYTNSYKSVNYPVLSYYKYSSVYASIGGTNGLDLVKSAATDAYLGYITYSSYNVAYNSTATYTTGSSNYEYSSNYHSYASNTNGYNAFYVAAKGMAQDTALTGTFPTGNIYIYNSYAAGTADTSKYKTITTYRNYSISAYNYVASLSAQGVYVSGYNYSGNLYVVTSDAGKNNAYLRYSHVYTTYTDNFVYYTYSYSYNYTYYFQVYKYYQSYVSAYNKTTPNTYNYYGYPSTRTATAKAWLVKYDRTMPNTYRYYSLRRLYYYSATGSANWNDYSYQNYSSKSDGSLTYNYTGIAYYYKYNYTLYASNGSMSYNYTYYYTAYNKYYSTSAGTYSSASANGTASTTTTNGYVYVSVSKQAYKYYAYTGVITTAPTPSAYMTDVYTAKVLTPVRAYKYYNYTYYYATLGAWYNAGYISAYYAYIASGTKNDITTNGYYYTHYNQLMYITTPIAYKYYDVYGTRYDNKTTNGYYYVYESQQAYKYYSYTYSYTYYYLNYKYVSYAYIASGTKSATKAYTYNYTASTDKAVYSSYLKNTKTYSYNYFNGSYTKHYAAYNYTYYMAAYNKYEYALQIASYKYYSYNHSQYDYSYTYNYTAYDKTYITAYKYYMYYYAIYTNTTTNGYSSGTKSASANANKYHYKYNSYAYHYSYISAHRVPQFSYGTYTYSYSGINGRIYSTYLIQETHVISNNLPINAITYVPTYGGNSPAYYATVALYRKYASRGFASTDVYQNDSLTVNGANYTYTLYTGNYIHHFSLAASTQTYGEAYSTYNLGATANGWKRLGFTTIPSTYATLSVTAPITTTQNMVNTYSATYRLPTGVSLTYYNM